MENESTIEQQIIIRAANLFLRNGFKSVTMDDLANNLAISKKTIYTYFPTKKDLVDRASLYILDFITAGIDEIRAQNLNPIQELFSINDYVYENLKNEKKAPEYQLSKYYPKTHQKINALKFKEISNCIAQNLTKGINIGIYRNDLSKEIITRIYFLSITGLCNEDMFPPSIFEANILNMEYLIYHIRGIATLKGIETLKQLQQERIK